MISETVPSNAAERFWVWRTALLLTFAGALLAFASVKPAPANAAFGLEVQDAIFTNADGTLATQAGSHPFQMTTTVRLNHIEQSPGKFQLDGGTVKDVFVEQVPGFIGDATLDVPYCPAVNFIQVTPGPKNTCPDNTAIGIANTRVESPDFPGYRSPVFNLKPPPGVPFELGFLAANVPVVVHVGVKPEADYNVMAMSTDISDTSPVFGAQVALWGDPTDPIHNPLRGFSCLGVVSGEEPSGLITYESNGNCSGPPRSKPFLTLPGNCAEPLPTVFSVDSWNAPGIFQRYTSFSHDLANPANPQPFTGCDTLNFSPSVEAQPTTVQAETPTGLDFNLSFNNEGLTSPAGRAQANIRKATVRLPKGMSINPSIAEGLGVCTPADYKRETLSAAPGAGCPNSSKIGTVEVETPLVDEAIKGSLFQAEQDDPSTTQSGAENPFDSLIALYIVFKNPHLGIIVKQPAKVEPDPRTGQLTTIVEDVPQLPFSHFKLHFREGGRSPLSTPPTCGKYTAEAEFVPWSDPSKIVGVSSSFEVTSGTAGSACPSGDTPPFRPGLLAGTVNNAAGRFSPFNVRLTRGDGDQEFTHFSIKLPPGIVGKLAGIPFCPDAAIDAARTRTGTAELESPSCPAASEVGRTLVGAGVGPELTYVPGKVYLAGPYHGSALSIVAITSAKVGPFDVGTVVVREALKIDSETAEVFVDATGSDPIPHIIKGIPVHARDIRVYVDRPEFVLNPSSCSRTSTASTVIGSGLDFASNVDDNPITVTSPFQAADCAALPFKPKLSLRLLGGTKRGAHPKFRARLKMNGIGEAAISKAQVTLPRSEFLENAHIKTICTRVQFSQGAVPGEKCPARSVYGFASAKTPILDEPLKGPVFLRSSEHQLPDLVAALHNGKININLVGRIDSVKGGGIRNTFETVPDAPVSTFTLTMQGGKKGLLVNSTDLCRRVHRADVDFDAHNGKIYDSRPPLKAKCGKLRKGKRPAAR